MTNHTKPANIPQEENSFTAKSIFVDEQHRLDTCEWVDRLEPHFPDLSFRQLAYISAAITHPEMEIETKLMVLSIGQLAGPDLSKPVTMEDAIAHMEQSKSGAMRFFLQHAEPEGHA